MACCIEDLLAQLPGGFDRLKDLNCSPLEHRFQDSVHKDLHVGITT